MFLDEVMKEDKTKYVLVEVGGDLYSVAYTSIQFKGEQCDASTVITCGNKLNPNTLLCAHYSECGNCGMCAKNGYGKCNCVGKEFRCENYG